MFGFLTLLFTLFVIAVTPENTSIVSDEITEIVIAQQENQEGATTSVISEEQAQQAPIIITNAIEPKMLQYKHWTGTYSPELFNVMIDNTLISSGETYTLKSTEEPLIVQFDYSFMNGIRKGSKKIFYQLNKDCKQATLTFSWLDTFKIIIDNATPIKEETIS